MRGALALLVAVVVAIAIGVTVLDATTPPGTSHTAGLGSPHLLLEGDGVGAIRFGVSRASAVAALDRRLGRPQVARPIALGCDVDAYVQWSALVAYFLGGRFVGYSTPLDLHASRHDANEVTSEGLHVGDTLARLERLYAGRVELSLEQGGSWHASTPTGSLSGYLTNELHHSPVPAVASIESGNLGCPAMAP